jgi:hypothetical protein
MNSTEEHVRRAAQDETPTESLLNPNCGAVHIRAPIDPRICAVRSSSTTGNRTNEFHAHADWSVLTIHLTTCPFIHPCVRRTADVVCASTSPRGSRHHVLERQHFPPTSCRSALQCASLQCASRSARRSWTRRRIMGGRTATYILKLPSNSHLSIYC